MKLTLTDVLVKRENPSRRIRKAKVNQYRIRVERMFFFSLKGKGFTGTLRTRKYKSGSPHILFSGLKIKKLSPSSPKHTHVHTHSPALASSFSRSLNLLFSIAFLTWISQKENILPKMFPLLVFFFSLSLPHPPFYSNFYLPSFSLSGLFSPASFYLSCFFFLLLLRPSLKLHSIAQSDGVGYLQKNFRYILLKIQPALYYE